MKLTSFFAFRDTSSHPSTSPLASAPSLWALSMAASRASSMGPSHVLSAVPSPMPLPIPSPSLELYADSSEGGNEDDGDLDDGDLGDEDMDNEDIDDEDIDNEDMDNKDLDLDLDKDKDVDEDEDANDLDAKDEDNEMGDNMEVEVEVEVEAVGSEGKENYTDRFMEASGHEPKAKDEIQEWRELRDQIQADIKAAYKRGEPFTHINKLLAL